MADIKTRDAVKGTIKTLDKAAVASERMKSAYAKTKEKAEEGYFSEESSPSEYAGNRLSSSAERVTKEGIHQFDKQGRKGVRETKENIIKAKECERLLNHLTNKGDARIIKISNICCATSIA